MIRKIGNKYRLISKTSHKNLGTYDTLLEAKARERQINYFKRRNLQ